MNATAETDPKAETATSTDDPRCVPIALDGPIPEGDEIPYPNYSVEEHDIWRTLYARQRKLLPGRACQEYIDGLELLKLPEDRVPALRDVSRVLEKATGWKLTRSPGLLHEKDFFERLARRVFPATDYVRPRHELDYTPAPDLFHDVFGHTPMIVHESFANFFQKIGQAAASENAVGDVRLGLVRIYWFTVEFGLINTPQGLRIYGNGITSSYGEVQHSLTDAVEKRPFIPEKVAQQEYDIWHMQPVLFVIDSFEQLERGFEHWAKSHRLL
ncbi:MAG: phenylalanine 4-monooxygenase [Verrucomicrobia bacterium]|nr:phenylalanine 4-monooxygenase [Verrucomicrobiota bacterium]MBV9658922.1 phenylalanine 4-monooxygenase [Verrucomicrobiota bacterium]